MSTATGLDVNFAEEDSSEEDEDLAPSTVAASAPSSVDADTAAQSHIAVNGTKPLRCKRKKPVCVKATQKSGKPHPEISLFMTPL